MVIQYYGGTCFRAQSGELSVLVDPESNRLKGDIVLKTKTTIPERTERAETIELPGEYEIKGIHVRGIGAPAEGGQAGEVHTVFTARMEDMVLAWMSGVATIVDADALERIGEPDILFIEVGGEGFSPEAAEALIKKLEPALVVPHGAGLEKFLKVAGEHPETQEKIVLKKKDIVPEAAKIMLLTSQ